MCGCATYKELIEDMVFSSKVLSAISTKFYACWVDFIPFNQPGTDQQLSSLGTEVVVQVNGLAVDYSHFPGGVAAALPARSRDLMWSDMY